MKTRHYNWKNKGIVCNLSKKIKTNKLTKTNIYKYIKNIYILIKKYFLGLGFRPLPTEDNVESTLIWYKGTEYENYKHWTNSLNEFLAGKYINRT